MSFEVREGNNETIIHVRETDMQNVLHEALSCINRILLHDKKNKMPIETAPVELNLRSRNSSELLSEFLNECLYLSNASKQLYRLKKISELTEKSFRGEIEPYYRLEHDEHFAEPFSVVVLKDDVTTQSNQVLAEISVQNTL